MWACEGGLLWSGPLLQLTVVYLETQNDSVGRGGNDHILAKRKRREESHYSATSQHAVI